MMIFFLAKAPYFVFFHFWFCLHSCFNNSITGSRFAEILSRVCLVGRLPDDNDLLFAPVIAGEGLSKEERYQQQQERRSFHNHMFYSFHSFLYNTQISLIVFIFLECKNPLIFQRSFDEYRTGLYPRLSSIAVPCLRSLYVTARKTSLPVRLRMESILVIFLS